MANTSKGFETDGGCDVRGVGSIDLTIMRARAWDVSNTHDLAVIDAEIARRAAGAHHADCDGWHGETDATLSPCTDCNPTAEHRPAPAPWG